MSYIQPYPTELESYVLKGVWKRYDEGQWSNLKWTLGSLSALLVMVGLTSLMALAQTQCWAMVRYIIAQYKKSPRLPGDPTPNPLLELSQGESIGIVLSRLSEPLSRIIARICHRERSTHPEDDPVESPLFGFASIMVILVFIVIGFAVPYRLTEGALGTPIVKSKIAEDCVNSENPENLLNTWNRQTRADEIFTLCRDDLNAGCDSPYWLSNPQITKTRPTTCPFQGSICLNNTASFQITHWNISAFEMGVNSRSKLLMNHRLICSPISLDPFLWRLENASIIYVQDLRYDTMIRDNVSLMLSTQNGPNKFSSESSGALMFEANGPLDLTVLPRNLFGANPFEPHKLNDLLQRSDSRPFLVIYRAGATKYLHDIDDPFFSAHNIIDSDKPHTCADYEATALGCVEQIQYCFPQSQRPIYCTDWGAGSDQYFDMLTYLWTHSVRSKEDEGHPHSLLERSNDQHLLSMNEMLNLFQHFQSRFGIYEYLSMRIEFHKMLPLRQGKMHSENMRGLDSDNEQWVLEVETWFMKAYLSGILTTQDGALFTFEHVGSGFSPEYIREWRLCGRILFHNQDFTNIDWIGFWITGASLVLAILIGNQVETIHRGWRYCMESRPVSWLKKLAGYIRQPRRPARQTGQMWNFALIYHSLSRVRPWPGSSARQNVASNAIQMADLEVLPSIHTEDGPSTNEY
jgi:hypothetical protein